MTSKTTSPRTEQAQALLMTFPDNEQEYYGKQFAAIEAEAAEPYRRVVEAAREIIARDAVDDEFWEFAVELREALAALDEAERD